MLATLFPWSQRRLIGQFAQREILARYRGSMLGGVWLVLTPLLMLAVYTIVFQRVFQSRWPHASGDASTLDFAINLYAGLLVFNLFSECISRAPHLIISQPNLVKKVIFPVEILTWVNLLNGLAHLGVGVLVLLITIAITNAGLPITALGLPVVILTLIPWLLGLSWLLSALGVYLRDVGQILGLAISLLMFLSPIFYPVAALPEAWQTWAYLNPLALIIEQTRQVLVVGVWPDSWALFQHGVLGSLVAVAGAYCFKRLRGGFADVL